MDKHAAMLSGLHRWCSSKNPPVRARHTGDMGSIPGSGRSPGGGNLNPFHYSCLGNSMDKGPWWATIKRAAELDMTKHAHTHTHILRKFRVQVKKKVSYFINFDMHMDSQF